MRVGYHASHEQFSPSELIEYVALAQAEGFEAAMCSDHLAPWTEQQGNSAFAWSWLGAAMQATSLPMGTVCAPGQRYHPTVLAQSIATLAAMYPGRFWVALGSGENLNEHVTGDPWPDKATRDARLRESVEVIRLLLGGEEVTHHGLVEVDRARLFIQPSVQPRLLGAALSEETAAAAAGWADGLICAPASPQQADAIVRAFREHGGHDRPVYAQLMVGFTEDRAAVAREWPLPALSPEERANLATVEEIEAVLGERASAAVPEHCLVSTDIRKHAAWLHEFSALGIDVAFIHNVDRDQRAFIEAYGRSGLAFGVSR